MPVPEAFAEGSLPWEDVTFQRGSMGIVFTETVEGRCRVKSFPYISGPAERKKVIKPGHVLVAINNKLLLGMKLADATQLLKNTPSPRTLVVRDMSLMSKLKTVGSTK